MPVTVDRPRFTIFGWFLTPGKLYKVRFRSNREQLTGPLWEGFRESRRCSRETYLELHIPEYTQFTKMKDFYLEVQARIWP